MEAFISLDKLKVGNKILLETKESVFDIEIVDPSKGVVNIVGSKRFLYPTEAIIDGAYEDSNINKLQIRYNQGLQINYTQKGVKSEFVTSAVVSALIQGQKTVPGLEHETWKFDVWEKLKTQDKPTKEVKNENSKS